MSFHSDPHSDGQIEKVRFGCIARTAFDIVIQRAEFTNKSPTESIQCVRTKNDDIADDRISEGDQGRETENKKGERGGTEQHGIQRIGCIGREGAVCKDGGGERVWELVCGML